MADPRPQATADTGASRRDQPFLDFCDGFFTGEATAARPTRGGADASDGFDATAYGQADLLEVHFADGSVYYTDPQEFAARHAGTAATRAAAGDDGRIRLPFTLSVGAVSAATRATRAGSAGEGGAAVDHYRIARLTDPTPLDTLYDWGAKFAGVLDRWFGGPSGPDLAVKRMATRLCRAFENAHLDPALAEDDGVLLRWNGGGWVPAAGTPLPEGLGEVVILLHGTASSTPGSFAGLWQSAAGPAADWQKLAGDGRRVVLAFDHRTLTVSPLRNVLDLLRQLGALGVPAGVTVQWLSHSRGGMVGDLLALALGSVDEVNARAALLRPIFEDAYPPDHPERAEVSALFELLQSRNWPPGWRPGTFVRVASPSRGTLLADRRTDFFLSLLLRSVALAFGGNGNPWFERLQGLVRGLVACRADAQHIPGLEAMIPGRPLSLALNTLPAANWALPGRLRVIAGDSQDLGFGGLATLLGDVFYGLHDHDFVVHTHAMFGGFPRTDALSRRVADKSVTHFGYFKEGSLTRGSVFVALAGDDSGFESLADDEARTRGLWQALAPQYSRWPLERWLAPIEAAGAARKPIVVVLPGVMGSELGYTTADADHPVWLAPSAIFSGALADLDLASPRPLRASGLMALAYERVLEKARDNFHVVGFCYDWRRPIPEAAGQLLDLLRRLLPLAERLDVPVHLLAHSMGGLVSRVALWCDGFGLKDRRGDLTARLEGRGLRLVQCGTPNRGSYAPVQLLMQQHPLTRNIAIAARGVSPRDLAGFGARYPGLLAMLPDEEDPGFGDLFDPAVWPKVVAADAANAGTEASITPPDATVLAQAAAVRAWLRDSFDALKANPRVFYLAGHDLTPLGLKLIGGGGGRPGLLRLGVSMNGDGTVPWNSTLAPERTWYTDCAHGSLLDHPPAFDGLFDLLLQGRTSRLSAQRPVSRAADDALADRVFEPAAPPSLVADPAAFVLGLDSRHDPRRTLPPILLRVVHGGLDHARHALLVGHCIDDGLFGAVRRVDTKLKGQLRRVLDYGLFDGRVLSSVYLRDTGHEGQPPAWRGAIVVGLGAVGTLTPGLLADTVTRGVLTHAFEHLHQDAWARGEGPATLRLSALLIGTQAQSLSVHDSLAALLQGVWRAAQVLAADAGLPRPVSLAELEIIELHEAVALDTAYTLRRLLARPDWAQRFHWPQPVLEARQGGVRGYRPGGEDTVWQRLLVRSDPFGALRFELLANRARVESTQNRADVASLQAFIAEACDAGAAGASQAGATLELGRMLFNLLLSPALKGRVADFEQTLLVVDDRAAALPWELLTPPLLRSQGRETAQPLAVQAGFIRQRAVGEFRADEAPRAASRMRRGRGVLVIGAPDTSGWSTADGRPLPFVDLKGAAAEARAVADRFVAQGWEVARLIRNDPVGTRCDGAGYTEVHRHLMRPEPWRVLHIAGHGMVDLWQRSILVDGATHAVRGTGLVLATQQMLTAGHVVQMDPAPDFVFLNCCYSGVDGAVVEGETAGAGRDLPRIASSLALAFIQTGSRAVVAAGWQVNDEDGRRFADALYCELLGGAPFGAAVTAARQAVYGEGGEHSNTWGAYQCYGDPNWRLTEGNTAAGSGAAPDPFGGLQDCMSAPELAERICRAVAESAHLTTPVRVQSLQALCAALGADPARAGWLREGAVLVALADAWRELAQWAPMLDAVATAAQVVHPALSLALAERAANALSRVAPADEAMARRSLDLLDQLDALEALLAPAAGDTGRSAAAAERDCLRGSTRARLAEHLDGLDVATRAGRQLCAASYYARAARLRLAQADASADGRAYALSNAVFLAARAARSGAALRRRVHDGGWWHGLVDEQGKAAPTPGGRGGLEAALAAVSQVQDELARGEGRDIWSDAGRLDLRLARLLLLWAVGRHEELARATGADPFGLLYALEGALMRGPSPTELASLRSRPDQALKLLAAPPAPRQPDERVAHALLTQAVQAVVARIEAAGLA